MQKKDQNIHFTGQNNFYGVAKTKNYQYSLHFANYLCSLKLDPISTFSPFGPSLKKSTLDGGHISSSRINFDPKSILGILGMYGA